MRRIFQIIVLAAFSLLGGCGQKTGMSLESLELSLEDNPDSVFSILQNLRSESENYDEKDKMHYGLLRLKCQNILDLPFDSIDTINTIVDYYANKESYNEALLSMYLKGLSYVVKENEPMAIECFNKCLALKANPNEKVDFIQLSKVHSQLDGIYRNQNIPQFEINELKAAEQCAYKGGDTLLALTYESLLSISVYKQGKMDSVINITQAVRNKYLRLGFKDKAAEVLYMSFIAYLEKKEYDNAKRCLNIYERESGIIDSLGNTMKGREIFYYMKGQLYEAYGQRDSAEYQYRKLLKYGEDINNLEGAYKGLLSIYRFKGNSDSIGKYADLYCEINDTVHARKVAYDISRLKAMYDYTEFKKKSEEMTMQAEATKARFIVTMLCVAILFIVFLSRVRAYRSRKQAEINRLLEDYDRTLQTIEDLNDDKEEMLLRHQNELKDIMNKLESKGISLTDDAPRSFVNDTLMGRLTAYADSVGTNVPPITDKEWQDVFTEMYNNDSEYMLLLREAKLTKKESMVAMLIRLRFKDFQIKRILALYGSSSLPTYKARVNKKLFDDTSAKTLRRLVYAWK